MKPQVKLLTTYSTLSCREGRLPSWPLELLRCPCFPSYHRARRSRFFYFYFYFHSLHPRPMSHWFPRCSLQTHSAVSLQYGYHSRSASHYRENGGFRSHFQQVLASPVLVEILILAFRKHSLLWSADKDLGDGVERKQ